MTIAGSGFMPRRRRRRRAVVVAIVVAVAVVVASTAGYRPASGRSGGDADSATQRLSRLRGYAGYPLYYPGASVGADRLSSVLNDRVPPVYASVERTLPKARVDRFDFIYGTCTPSGGGLFEGAACTPPLDVQEVPACALDVRVLGSADRRVRGVPAHWDGDGLRLYTAATTVTIFGDHGLAGDLRAAAQLRSLNGRAVATAAPLPAPTRLERQGHKPCRDGG